MYTFEFGISLVFKPIYIDHMDDEYYKPYMDDDYYKSHMDDEH